MNASKSPLILRWKPTNTALAAFEPTSNAHLLLCKLRFFTRFRPAIIGLIEF